MNIKHLFKRIAVALIVFCSIPDVFAETPDVRTIMQRANEVDMGNAVKQDVTITQIDKFGNEKVQVARSFRKKLGEGKELENRHIMFYMEPENMAGTGFLSIDFDDPEKEDKQWLYLPGIKLTKRIAGNDKRLSFMGTDFSHADMAMRNIDNYDYNMLPDEEIDGHKVWVVESIPRNKAAVIEDGYLKSTVYIRQDSYMLVKSVNQLKRGGRTKILEVNQLEKDGDHWIHRDVSMTTMKGGEMLSKTSIVTNKIKFNNKFKDELFTVRTLEAGLDAAD
jgi:hypothetical protein